MTPRAFVAAVVGLGLLLLVAACGGDPTATPAPEQPPAVDSPRIAALKAASEAKGLRFLTHDEIVAGARREGALVAVPGFDDITFPELKAAFETAYPYIDLKIEIVSGTEAGERLNFAMLAGRADVDVIEASSSDWPLYADYDLLLPYDYRAMAEAGELAVSPEAISDTVAGQLPFFASGIDAIAYNTDLVAPEDAPTGWDDCIDPKWAGKVATDTSTALSGLLGAWTEDEIIAYAKAMKDNDVIFVRGVTATLVRLLSGEFHIMCPTNYHGALRQLIADPDAPMKIVLPDPLSIGPREQEGIYAGAKHPHAALLWMEFVSTPVVQLDILAAHDPGKASYLVEGTVPYELLRTFEGEITICAGECQVRSSAIDARIVVEAWGFPRVGATPK